MSKKVILSVGIWFAGQAAIALTLSDYKDGYFSNKRRTILESREKGAYVRYRWDEMEDVNGRDTKEKPGSEARPERLDMDAVKQQRDIIIKYAKGEIDTFEVGNPKDAKFAVIFIHGSGGDKNLGVADLRFGGNFNRLKSLATRNGGVYYSPSVELPTSTPQDMIELVRHIKKNSPNAKIAMVCGSAGASTCWNMANNKETAQSLSGLIFTGGAGTHGNFKESEAYKAKLPIVISHGSKDPVVPIKEFVEQFDEIKKLDANYPVRMEVYEGGKHGTPLRMIDYKETLEWVFAKGENMVKSPGQSAVPTRATGQTQGADGR